MKIYPLLRVLWGALAVSAAVNLAALSNSMAVLLAANIINLLAYVVVAYVLYRLSDESALLGRAFPAQMLSIVLIGMALVVTQLAGDNLMLQNFMSLLSMAGSVAGLLSDYYLYWGLDERIIPHAYNYPARRIRWCLYAPLLGAFAASLLMLAGQLTLLVVAVIVQLGAQIVPLVLLRQYMRAVQVREDDPLSF
ncbi:hypothetical protein [Agathobaculum sp. Marseille-P7918]|uniref:hypothetical protein n=1 Tax=Agathobaculum sp. Marseille-P7918 TaxID=2479843 RepID=UPI000F62DE19|nr:hypothetical protein [Agathobaculum sp. Marseille-P7918]